MRERSRVRPTLKTKRDGKVREEAEGRMNRANDRRCSKGNGYRGRKRRMKKED